MSRAPILVVLAVVVGLIVLVSADGDDQGLQVGEGSAATEQQAPEQPEQGGTKKRRQANAGDSGASSPQDATQQLRASAKPTKGCGERVLGPDAEAVVQAPVPELSAARVGDQARVRVRFLATPAECRPAVVDIRIGRAGSGVAGPAGGLIPVQEAEGSILIKLPRESGPPYEARAIALTATGAPSPAVVAPVR